RGVLDAVTRLVGELAEVDLPFVGGLAQHPDVCPRAEDALLSRGQHDGPHLRMLESQPLAGVVQLDVNAEIVRVELELVAGLEPAVLLQVHRQRPDSSVDVELPVLVPGRVGPEVDHHTLTAGFGHRRSPEALSMRARWEADESASPE